MSNGRADYDPEEREFLRSFGSSSEGLPTCPAPELLLAADSGSLPEERGAEVIAHLRSCSRCSALLRDLSDRELADPQPEEAARIRNRVFDGIAVPDALTAWRVRPSFALAAALSLAFIGVLLWYSSSNVVTTSRAPVKAAPRQTVFRVEKAPVKLPASILVWRGPGGGYEAELGRAIALYRSEQYSQAAQQFEAIARTNPQSVEAQFYLGVSQLLVGRASDARASLIKAREMDRGSLTDDISWYLALANVKTGNSAEAMSDLRKLCPKPGGYSARACAGIQEIEANRE
jgi:tetratricopeptide (TPR) repeat protein